MKTLLILLVAIGFSFSAENPLYNQKQKCYDLFDEATVILDSGEVDTATDVWDLGNFTMNQDGIIGLFSSVCKDSAGTDSVAVNFNFEMNFNDGLHSGFWVEVDNLDIDRASTEALDTAVVNVPNGYAARYIRVVAESNASSAGEKVSCQQIKLCVQGERQF